MGNAPGADPVNQINKYLAAVKLDSLITASDFSFQHQVSENTPQGNTILNNVWVLKLKPSQGYDDAAVFSEAWNDLVAATANTISIYTRLFFKATDYTQVSPDSLAISFETGDAKKASFLIYFNAGIKVNTALVKIRGANNALANLDLADPGNVSENGFWPKAPDNDNTLTQRIENGVIAFMKKTSSDPDPKKWGVGTRMFKFYKSNGMVMPDYYEIITIYVYIMHYPDNKTADIAYTFDVLFASRGPSGSRPSNIGSYENAALKHKQELDRFGGKLRDILYKIAYDPHK